MEHVNDLCFRDIYTGGLWEDRYRSKTVLFYAVETTLLDRNCRSTL